MTAAFQNPFRPGTGHMPPYLAGREVEKNEFLKLLEQTVILQNLIITGLRGIGKTVLVESFKPIAQQQGWKWASSDLSEIVSASEDNLVKRLLTDISAITSSLVVKVQGENEMGFGTQKKEEEYRINLKVLEAMYANADGLAPDKLITVFRFVWSKLKELDIRGVVFAYDEAQNMSDKAERDQFPLSLLLDVFSKIQKEEIPFMLVLVGLPTLQTKLVSSRTYSERMFRVLVLKKLTNPQSEEAVTKPIEQSNCPVHFTEGAVRSIVGVSGGYPYFIQYICRETFDYYLHALDLGGVPPEIPLATIIAKLDSDFFAARWLKVSDRQRVLLKVISSLPNCDDEFTISEVVEKTKVVLANPMSSSHVAQMLETLTNHGLVYKNRHGKYLLAVPLMANYVRRQPVELD